MKGKLLALVVAVLSLTATAATAAPVAGATKSAIATADTSVDLVQYRGGYGRSYGYRRYGGWRGPAIGLGIGSAIVAGAIIANRSYAPRRGYYYDTYDYVGPYYYPSEYRGDPRTICARHFRSFEWRTGLYTTYQGEKRLCPYLRE